MMEFSDEQVAFYTYLDELMQEMWEVYERHEQLGAEYSRGMEVLHDRGIEWRQGYSQWVAMKDTMVGEGVPDGDSSD